MFPFIIKLHKRMIQMLGFLDIMSAMIAMIVIRNISMSLSFYAALVLLDKLYRHVWRSVQCRMRVKSKHDAFRGCLKTGFGCT